MVSRRVYLSNATMLTHHYNPLCSLQSLLPTQQIKPSLSPVAMKPPPPPDVRFGGGFGYGCWFNTPPVPVPTSGTSAPPSAFSFHVLLTLHSGPGEYFSIQYAPALSSLILSMPGMPPTPLLHQGAPTPLAPNTWHHLVVSYTPPKGIIRKRGNIQVMLNGHEVQHDVTVSQLTFRSLSSTSCLIGHPPPALISSTPPNSTFKIGPVIMTSAPFTLVDAICMFTSGPTFTAPFWGEAPLHQSNLSIRTLVLRHLHSLVSGHNAVQKALTDLGISRLIFQSLHLPISDVTFAFNANATSEGGEVFHNTADLSENAVGEGRMVFGDNFEDEGNEVSRNSSCSAAQGIVYSPSTFAVNTQRVGGTLIFMPLLHSAASPEVVVEILLLMKTTLKDLSPNLEVMQSGGGWKGVGWCLWKKRGLLNAAVMDACFGCAVEDYKGGGEILDENKTFLLTDWDALRILILNHQLWLNDNISTGGEDLLMHQLKVLNKLVDGGCDNASFNARGLYHVGIVEWGINIMLEAMSMDPPPITPILASQFALGSDPPTPSFLLLSKTLLRHVLSNYLDKKKDLLMISEVTIYTLTRGNTAKDARNMDSSSMVRVYLLRLLMELVTEGIDHLYANTTAPQVSKRQSATTQITSLFKSKSNSAAKSGPGVNREAVAFISVFATTLTPTWFACILEGSSEEASASTALRLLLMLMQSSEGFRAKFKVAGGFDTLISSTPKFSTCPALLLPLIGFMLQMPVRQIPTLPSLQGPQVVKLFDSLPFKPNVQIQGITDGFGSLCFLVSEIIGRNIQLCSSNEPEKEDIKAAALECNNALLHVMKTVIEFDSEDGRYDRFRRLACTDRYIEPIVQALFVAADIIDKHNTKGGRVEGHRKGSIGADITANIEDEYVPTGSVSRKVSFTRRISASSTMMNRRASSTISSGMLNIDANIGEIFVGDGGKVRLDWCGERLVHYSTRTTRELTPFTFRFARRRISSTSSNLS
jgi:hypothetical protein